ncbi:hypothetical protein AGLY_002039 [Aphis glycines]|uniref:DDE-1 domain-containing protein n=1 Tax=Aphis glycines TaxID=307491 RepID=A0A6G0U3X7_APHGL|nr:hypothetical protein AGLY_002039 [Aphis glycines]
MGSAQMARKYRKKIGARSYKNYSDEILDEALDRIANGEISILAASKAYKIFYGTLHNRFNGKHGNKSGRPTIFSEQEEMSFLTAAMKCGKWGFPLTLMDLRVIAKSYLDRKGIVVESFSKNLPATNIARCRAEVSPQCISEYFDNLQQFLTAFLPHAKRQPGRKVLIGYNLSSHIQQEVIVECEQNDIDFVCLPKNSTHLTQPLDVGFFRPLKQAWRNALNEWKTQNTRLKAIPKASFPTLVQKAIDSMDSYDGGGSIANDLQAYFKATGIYPLNKQKVMDKLPNTNDSDILINDTVTDYLKSQRYPNADENARKKRKKITVAAGVSITVATFGINYNEISDKEVEVSNLPILTNDSESEHEVIDDSIPEYQPPSKDNIKIGTFFLVNVKFGKRGMSIYVYFAVIKNIKDNVITVT